MKLAIIIRREIQRVRQSRGALKESMNLKGLIIIGGVMIDFRINIERTLREIMLCKGITNNSLKRVKRVANIGLC